MSWIRTVPESEASGDLKAFYDEAARRAGRVFNILKVMSLNPGALRACVGLHMATTLGTSPLSRAQREMLAVVVSSTNGCHY